jgi:hypothetical protein
MTPPLPTQSADTYYGDVQNVLAWKCPTRPAGSAGRFTEADVDVVICGIPAGVGRYHLPGMNRGAGASASITAW